jgi:hypothetical protein
MVLKLKGTDLSSRPVVVTAAAACEAGGPLIGSFLSPKRPAAASLVFS